MGRRALEIAAQISSKSAVQKHVLDHLRDYVVENVRIVGSSVQYIRYQWQPLESPGMRFRFYVDPQTRKLCLAPVVSRKRRKKDAVNRIGASSRPIVSSVASRARMVRNRRRADSA